MHFIKRLNQWFIEDYVKTAIDEFEVAKIRLTYNFLLLTAIIYLLYIPYLLYYNCISQLFMVLAGIIISTTSLFIIKYKQNFKFCALINTLCFFIGLICVVAYNKGKIDPLTFSWTLSFILFAFFILGKKWGIFFSILNFSNIFIVIINSYETYNVKLYNDNILDYLINLIFPISFLLYISNQYTKLISETIEKLKESRTYQEILNKELNQNNYLFSLAQKQLKENERKFRLISENSKNLIMLCNQDYQITYVSPIVKEMLGYEQEELIMQPPDIIIHPDYRQEFKQNYTQALTQDLKKQSIFKALKKNKRSFWLETLSKGIKDEEDTVIGVQLSSNDITHQKNHELTLEQTQQLAKVGGWEYDLKRDELILTEEFYKIYELPKEKSIKLNELMNLYQYKWRKILKQALNAVIAEGNDFDKELEFDTLGKKHKWLRVIGKAVREDSETVKLIGAVQDITERKESEIRLKRIQKQREIISEMLSLSNALISFHEKINRLMEIAGNFMKANRVFIFEYNQEKKILNNTVEWNALDSSSQIDDLQNIPYQQALPLISVLKLNKFIFSKHINNDFTDNILRFMKLEDNISIIAFPLYIQDKFIGLIGITSNREIWDNNGVVFMRSMSSMISNLLERKEAKDIIRKSALRFREFAKMLPEMVGEINLDQKITFVNDFSLKHFGYTESDLEKGIYLKQLLIPDEEEKIKLHFLKVLQGKDMEGIKYTAVKRNGEKFPIVAYVNLIEKSHVLRGFRFVIIDITGQIETEKKIRSLAKFPEEDPDPVIRVTKNGEIIYSNNKSLELQRFLKTQHNLFLEIFNEIYEINKIKEIEFRADQSYFRLTLVPVKEFEYINIYGKNITLRKKAEQELKKAKEIAEEVSNSKALFLSTMSHEIRTPLNAIIGITYLLLKENPRSSQKENLETLKFSAESLLVLVNDILDFNKIEAGKIKFEEIEFNLQNLLDNLEKTFKLKASQKDINLIFEKDPLIPLVLIGDTTRLTQILNNLLSNAVKFTNKGYVKLSLQLKEKDPESVIINFSVIDTGIGISTNKTDAIFESFNQASSDITRKYGGTGLGLAITKKLLELQGSQINLKSQPGVGSKFYFSLKFKIGKRSIEETTAPAGTRPLFSSMAGIKILIVEDNQINQFVAKKILSHWDIKTDTAKNGNLAVRKVKSDMYDLILMDLQMPEMDGYQATRIIKQMNGGKFKNIPVIALTASILSDVKNKIYEAGMNDYISKPFNPKELYEKISKYAFLNPEKLKKENAKNAHGN